MTRIFLVLFLMPLYVFAQKTGFEINGSVTGFGEGTAVKLENGNDGGDYTSHHGHRWNQSLIQIHSCQ